MMVRGLGGSLLGLALLIGCAAPAAQPPSRAETCVALYGQYDYYSQMSPRRLTDDGTIALPGNLSRLTQQLISNGCLTMSDDLAGLEQLGARLGFRKPVDSGPAIRPTAVQVGVLTSFTDVTRATVFFGNLGYQTRTIGADGLGRRLYIGPLVSEGAMNQAMDTARQAGFISPYPSKIFRFW